VRHRTFKQHKLKLLVVIVAFDVRTLRIVHARVSQPEPSTPLGDVPLDPPWEPGDHEQRPLRNSSAVILQNPIDEQGATSVDSLWKGATNDERLRTTALCRSRTWTGPQPSSCSRYLRHFLRNTCNVRTHKVFL